MREHLATLRALLRLIDPESPFQPILLSSIDIVTWLALFGRAAEQLGNALPGMPAGSGRDAASRASQQFLRLADALCANAEIHAFPSTDRPPRVVPDIPPFCPTSAISAEDADAIAAAEGTAFESFKASARHHTLLCRTLGLAAGNLKKKLSGRDGLLRLMKHRGRASRPFRRHYDALAGSLTGALAELPDPAATPWEKCRSKFATVRHLLVTDLLPRLDSIVAGLGSDTRSTVARRATIGPAVTAFIEAHGLATSLDTGLQAVQYHTLFRDLLTQVTATLSRVGSLTATASETPRLLDDLRRLSPEVIKHNERAAWDVALRVTDPYTVEVVLAALYHLERPLEGVANREGQDTRILGMSDANLATWLRGGRYAGADARAEISGNRAAEIKRVGRTLQHLRRVGAAFHDRRLWTPTHSRNADSTQHRLWTVNPLLVIHARITARLDAGPAVTAMSDSGRPAELRPRPTRRNRGTRPRAPR